MDFPSLFHVAASWKLYVGVFHTHRQLLFFLLFSSKGSCCTACTKSVQYEKMVFNFKTFDLTEDINTTFPYSLPSSPESTICLPLGRSRTRSVAVRVASGISQIFTSRRLEQAASQGKKESREEGLRLSQKEFPDQKQLQRFLYEELEVATGFFSEKNIIGRGGFGTVYKGHLSSGRLVAVKRLNRGSRQGVAEFRAELEVGKMVMHRNVVLLIGFCELKTCEEWLLVYPFIGNGSLSSHLYNRPESQPASDWYTRNRIALGVARGLSYLHDHCSHRIIHRDIKPSNILLDENFEPRIGDFGLARAVDHTRENGCLTQVLSEDMAGIRSSELTHFSNRLCGTFFYMAPEYLTTGKYSPKTDVYAYGITLLELITGCDSTRLGKLASSEGVEYPLDWVKRLADAGNTERIVDKSMRGEYSKAEFEKLTKLSLICTQSHPPERRPNMSEVVSILKGSSSLDTRWQEVRQNWVELVGSATASYSSRTSTAVFAYSSCHLDPEELSAPR